MNIQIKGSIPYLITIKDNQINVDYPTTQDNDIAALAISELILRSTADYYTEEKRRITGGDKTSLKNKKHFGNMANILKKGRSATSRILDVLLNTYEGFKEEKRLEEEKVQEKAAEIKKYLEDKGVTIEKGVMNKEEVEKLLDERTKNLLANKAGDETKTD